MEPIQAPVFVYVEIDGKKYIDTEKSYCLQAPYQYSLEKIGSVGPSVRKPIFDCDRMVGHPAKSFPRASQWIDDIRALVKKGKEKFDRGEVKILK